MLITRVLVLASALLPFTVLAQDNRAALAEELLTLTKPEKTIDQVFQQMTASAQQQFQTTAASDKPRADEMLKEFTSYMHDKLDWAKLKPQFVQVYSETFTETELRGQIAFYKSPSGQAMLTKMPILLQKTFAITQAQMADLPAYMQQMMIKLKKSAQEENENNTAPKP